MHQQSQENLHQNIPRLDSPVHKPLYFPKKASLLMLYWEHTTPDDQLQIKVPRSKMPPGRVTVLTTEVRMAYPNLTKKISDVFF